VPLHPRYLVCWLSSTREFSQIWLFVGYHPQENLAKFDSFGDHPQENFAKFGYLLAIVNQRF